MAILNGILSGPVPSVIAILIALLLMAGYWFFVIPLISEAASLRKRNNELTSEIAGIQSSLSKIASSISEVKILCVEAADGNQKTFYPKLLEQHDALCKIMRDLRRSVAELQDKSTRSDAELIREIERIIRMISEVNDKQSQVSGVILGLTMSNAHNPARGI